MQVILFTLSNKSVQYTTIKKKKVYVYINIWKQLNYPITQKTITCDLGVDIFLSVNTICTKCNNEK